MLHCNDDFSPSWMMKEPAAKWVMIDEGERKDWLSPLSTCWQTREKELRIKSVKDSFLSSALDKRRKRSMTKWSAFRRTSRAECYKGKKEKRNWWFHFCESSWKKDSIICINIHSRNHSFGNDFLLLFIFSPINISCNNNLSTINNEKLWFQTAIEMWGGEWEETERERGNGERERPYNGRGENRN